VIEPIYLQDTSDPCNNCIRPCQVGSAYLRFKRLIVESQVFVGCKQVFDVRQFGSCDLADSNDAVSFQNSLIRQLDKTLVTFLSRIEQNSNFKMMSKQSHE
jgi:hypothetical protein